MLNLNWSMWIQACKVCKLPILWEGSNFIWKSVTDYRGYWILNEMWRKALEETGKRAAWPLHATIMPLPGGNEEWMPWQSNQNSWCPCSYVNHPHRSQTRYASSVSFQIKTTSRDAYLNTFHSIHTLLNTCNDWTAVNISRAYRPQLSFFLYSSTPI